MAAAYKRRSLGWLVKLALVLAPLGIGLAATALADPDPGTQPEIQSGPGVEWIDQLLPELIVVDQIPAVDGYDRGCRQGEGCVFGTAWTDDNDADHNSRNGCDTRQDVLGEQLVGVVFKAGTRDCKVLSGILHDPYTGASISFSRERPEQVQIDTSYLQLSNITCCIPQVDL